MENNNTNHDKFEDYIRRAVDQHQEDDSGADELWQKIAEKQLPANRQLHWQHKLYTYGPIGFLAAATVVGILWFAYPNTETPAQVAPTVVADQATQQPVTTDVNAPALTSVQQTGAPLVVTTTSNPAIQTPPPAWVPRNQVPLQRSRFSAEQGLRFESVSGTTVFIPANVLVDAQGRPVQGEVDLFFRDYRSIPDLFAADIPMHYTDERGQFVFNTGGMFDIRVGQDGEPVFLAPGATYDVQFTPTNKLSEANLYYFDQQRKAWDYVSSDVFGGSQVLGKKDKPLPRVVAEDVMVAENLSRLPLCVNKIIPLTPDKSLGERVQQGILGGKAVATETKPIPKALPKYADREADVEDGMFDEQGNIWITYRRDVISQFFPQDKSGIYKELDAFKDCYFVRIGDSLLNSFDPSTQQRPTNMEAALRQTKPWSKIQIDRVDGVNCRILLFDDKEQSAAITAKLVQSNEVPTRNTFNPQAVFERYKKMREARLQGVADRMMQLIYFARYAKLFQPEAEQCMELKDWLLYFEKNRPAMKARYDSLSRLDLMHDPALAQKFVEQWNKNTTRKMVQVLSQAGPMPGNQALTKTLRLTGFGLYNCDQIYRLSRAPEYVDAVYRNDAGERVQPRSVEILDWERSMFLPLPKPDQMIRLNGKRIDVVIRDQQGRVYHLPGEAYQGMALNNRSECTFYVNDVTQKAKSPGEWAKLLQL